MSRFADRTPAMTCMLVVGMLVSACGSTNLPDRPPGAIDEVVVEDAPSVTTGGTTGGNVTGDATAAENSTTGDATGGDSSSTAGGATDGGSGTATTTGGSDATGGSTAGGATSGGATTGATTSGGAGDDTATTGGGTSAESLQIGFQISQDINAAFAAVGANNTAPNARRIVEALVAWVNANGGLGGRPIEPVIHETDPISGTWSSQAQAACSTFTEDNDVFAVLSSPVGGSNAMLACLAEKQTPLFEQNLWPYTDADYQAHRGLLYQPGKMTADRWIPAWADMLVEAGFFGDDLTDPNLVGLVRFDAPHFDQLANDMLKPALAEHGVEFEDEVELSTVRGAGDFGQMNSEINNAIVRFRSRGIDHIVFLEWSGVVPFFWHPQAESQGYRPRPAYNSQSIPATIAREASAAQVEGGIGASWTPPNDVFDEQHPGGNPAWELCNAIMDEAGVNWQNEGFYTMSRCDTVFALKSALDRATEFTNAGLLAAVESLRDSYVSPHTFGPTRFGPGRYAGATAVQQISYDVGCECFVYVGQRRPVP